MELNTAILPVPAQSEENHPAPKTGAITVGSRGIQLRSIDDIYRVSKYICVSAFAPKGSTPESVTVAILAGQEIGLPPMASVQNIAVINGRPKIFGDVMLGLIRASGQLESFSETTIGKSGSDDFGYRCTAKRKGGGEVTEEFTVGDAKQASLWGKQGPWVQYPKRMLKFRARSFALRDLFGDVLNGMGSVEEDFVIDVQTEDLASAPRKTLAARSKPAAPIATIEDMTGGEEVDDVRYEFPGDAAKEEKPAKTEEKAPAPAAPVPEAKAEKPAEGAGRSVYAELAKLMEIAHVTDKNVLDYAESVHAVPAMAIRIEEIDEATVRSWVASWSSVMGKIWECARAHK